LWRRPGVSGVILLGTTAKTPIFDVGQAELTHRINDRGLGIEPQLTPETILNGIILSEAQIRAEAGRYEMVTDDRPYTEFPLLRFWQGQVFFENSGFLDRLVIQTSTQTGN
jgi:hypothetical protein